LADYSQYESIFGHRRLRQLRVCYERFITDRVSEEAKAIASVRLSVRPFVTTLSFEPTGL